jgi:energy-coupling factor transport system ATP-binding protein
MSVLSLKNVSYEYPGGYLAVDGVTIDAKRGERIAIIGQNGAGKTTAVKMCNGLLRPTAGSVIVDGADTKNLTAAAISRTVGYVFQNPDDQIFHSTVSAEVEFAPKMMKLPRERIDELTDYAIGITGLRGVRGENPYCLPLSVRKFITIAAVMAMDSKVLIFDEPTAGQDLRGLTMLREILRELSEKGKTVITISHDMEFVAENFPRVVVMANKKILADGSPREIFQNSQILKEAKLSRPYAGRLCDGLKLGDDVVTVGEAADLIETAYNRKGGIQNVCTEQRCSSF